MIIFFPGSLRIHIAVAVLIFSKDLEVHLQRLTPLKFLIGVDQNSSKIIFFYSSWFRNSFRCYWQLCFTVVVGIVIGIMEKHLGKNRWDWLTMNYLFLEFVFLLFDRFWLFLCIFGVLWRTVVSVDGMRFIGRSCFLTIFATQQSLFNFSSIIC